MEAHPYWRNQELIDWCKASNEGGGQQGFGRGWVGVCVLVGGGGGAARSGLGKMSPLAACVRSASHWQADSAAR